MEELNHRTLRISNIKDIYPKSNSSQINLEEQERSYNSNVLVYNNEINKVFERFFYIYNTQKKMFDIMYNKNKTKTLELNLICVNCYNNKLEICNCSNNIDIVQLQFNSPFSTKFNLLFNESTFELSENFETNTISLNILDVISVDNEINYNFKQLLNIFFEVLNLNTIEDGKITFNENKYLNENIDINNTYNFNYIDKYLIYLL
jgi:hypothetical protein